MQGGQEPGGVSLRRKVFVALVSLIASFLVVSQLNWFETEYVLDSLVYVATGPLWPLFWGFAFVLTVGLILDW